MISSHINAFNFYFPCVQEKLNTGTPAVEGALASFFNSLLTKKAGPSSPGGMSAGGSPRPSANGLSDTPDRNITRNDVAAELDRISQRGDKLDFSQSDC